jgi:hypothetical protein
MWADIKPIDRLLISASFSHINSDALETEEQLFSQAIFRTRLSLQFTRELSARIVLQYNDRYGEWDFDPLIAYRINSFSIFYIGSTHRYENMNAADHGTDGWTLSERQYFMKLQYLFRL